MDYKAEQSEELQVLESIYPSELTRLTEKSFSVDVKLEVEPFPTLRLLVTYPETYPSVIPLIKLEAVPDEANDEQDLVLEPADLLELVQELRALAQDNLGTQSVFTLLSALKDDGEKLLLVKKQTKEDMNVQRLLQAEQEEQKKFIGTPVTADSFAEWRRRFKAEMHVAEPELKVSGSLTGKQIFEQGLLTEVEIPEQ